MYSSRIQIGASKFRLAEEDCTKNGENMLTRSVTAHLINHSFSTHAKRVSSHDNVISSQSLTISCP